MHQQDASTIALGTIGDIYNAAPFIKQTANTE